MSKINIPVLPDRVEDVREMLHEIGVSKWRETEISPGRIDLTFTGTDDQKAQILRQLREKPGVFALKGISF